MANKLFIGFGIVTLLSGIFLVIDKDYVIGISGSFVGLLLIYQNIQAIKNNDPEKER